MYYIGVVDFVVFAQHLVLYLEFGSLSIFRREVALHRSHCFVLYSCCDPVIEPDSLQLFFDTPILFAWDHCKYNLGFQARFLVITREPQSRRQVFTVRFSAEPYYLHPTLSFSGCSETVKKGARTHKDGVNLFSSCWK